MLRSFRVVMILRLGATSLAAIDREMDLGSWLPAIGRSRRHMESQTLFLSGDIYTSRRCHVHVHQS